MGIPFLYSWLKNKRYKGVLRRNVPNYVSSFSLDANGIIHAMAQLVYAYGEGKNPARAKIVAKSDPRSIEAEFHLAISTKFQEILAQVRPQEIFVIAVDGVAPQAKISQQRQRRFRSAMDRGDIPFDSNAITPGTDFMIRLDNFIQRWIVTYQATLPPKVIYSSHMVPGEGEHKIFDMIRSGEISGNGAHVLYGMDADLIMLSMIAPIDNITLMREDIKDIISIDSLKYTIQQELKLPTAINDFVVMLFTLGNDFLPHMPSLENMREGIKILTKVYLETGKSLTNDDGINWEGMKIFLTNLTKEESELLKTEASRDVKYPSRMLQVASKRTEKLEHGKVTFETTFDFNVFRGAWYNNALVPKGNLSVFQKIMPGYNFGVTMNKVVDMANQYLTGMAWIYRYYTKGTVAINADYVYRHHHTPLLIDLSAVLNQSKIIEGYEAHKDMIIMNPIHQLLSVLPLKSKNLLPKEVTNLMTKDSPIADMYPEKVMIERDGKNREWQGTVLIPFVDPKRVIQAVNATVMFTRERALLYSQGNNIVLKRDPELEEIEKQKQSLKRFISSEKQKKYGGRGGYNNNRGGYRDNRNRGGYDRGNNNNRNNQQNRGYGDNRSNSRDNRSNRGYGDGYNKNNKNNRNKGRGRGGYRKNNQNNQDNQARSPRYQKYQQPQYEKFPIPNNPKIKPKTEPKIKHDFSGMPEPTSFTQTQQTQKINWKNRKTIL